MTTINDFDNNPQGENPFGQHSWYTLKKIYQLLDDFSNQNTISSNNLFYFKCQWHSCAYQCYTENEILFHVHEHCKAIESHISCLSIIVCQIYGCRVQLKSVHEFKLHISYHLYLLKLQYMGYKYLAEKVKWDFFDGCGFAKQPSEVSDECPLICRWRGCKETFYSVIEFYTHVDKHVNSYPRKRKNDNITYQCQWNDCIEIYDEKFNFGKHVNTHTLLKKCACPYCGERFLESTRLRDHMNRKVKNENDAKYTCDYCCKKFKDKQILESHSKRHYKDYECLICHAKMSCPSTLARHVSNVHGDGEEYKCRRCNKKYYTKTSLKGHEELCLSGEKEIKCSECSAKFEYLPSLKRHFTSAHQKPFTTDLYMCHICEVEKDTKDVKTSSKTIKKNGVFLFSNALSTHLKDVHKLTVPKGFVRFKYRKCPDTFFRLELTPHCRRNN
ncbi:Histone H4 transcription factor [Strongyloides ratti]|uniref:Histone H4 transcription factor n=1 Tax=Strongyloides ratti TaxID=34506 RepID=A0A090LQ87_STRRB|nr:Histone H4 transcription factor [Strongyloides ratti]CEF69696.1 Histone H4 transcription factor [Strongyloides ratti]